MVLGRPTSGTSSTRYSVYNPTAAQEGRTVDIVEICNEPNLTTGDPQPQKTAELMYIANYIRFSSNLNAPILAGPALADNNSWDDFSTKVLNALSSTWYFKGNYWFAWSMHNYIDIGDRNTSTYPPTPPTTARAQAMRQKLVNYGWQGWPLQATGDAYTAILHTEGGGLSADRNDKVRDAYNLWRTDTAGKNLLMFTQYLNVTNPTYDTGMRETGSFVVPYASRQLRDRWTALPHT